mmetsp:Transcript_3442/g.15694  ORF Transcript_3442/g.15694 Transcript_3442/m.15694 type:complete len:218 (-) Transcript_3442:7639-8292(-)
MIPSPLLPARAVRPSLWMYWALSDGAPICTTSETSGKSIPRAVTSEVIITACLAVLNCSVALVRRLWESLLWISITSGRMCWKSSAASCVALAVVKNTITLKFGVDAQCVSRMDLSAANCSTWGTERRLCFTCRFVADSSSPTQSTKTCPGRSDCLATCWISWETVAEKSKVWRAGGTYRRIFSIAGLNPMSSSRSASSNTRVSHDLRRALTSPFSR